MYSNLKLLKILIFWCLKDCSVNQSIFIMGEPAPTRVIVKAIEKAVAGYL